MKACLYSYCCIWIIGSLWTVWIFKMLPLSFILYMNSTSVHLENLSCSEIFLTIKMQMTIIQDIFILYNFFFPRDLQVNSNHFFLCFRTLCVICFSNTKVTVTPASFCSVKCITLSGPGRLNCPWCHYGLQIPLLTPPLPPPTHTHTYILTNTNTHIIPLYVHISCMAAQRLAHYWVAAEPL